MADEVVIGGRRCVAHERGGVVHILPRAEAGPRWAKRLGPVAIGLTWRWTGFGVGVDVLPKGVLVQIGPAYFWCARLSAERI